MSRPKSDGKRKAILEAALRLFAERGVAGTPTAAISKAAGVAEGTLFRYFKTKDELINELYLVLRKMFDEQLKALPADADVRGRLRFVWDKYLDIGLAHPEYVAVIRQLRVSGRLRKELVQEGVMMSEIVTGTQQAVAASEFHHASPEFVILLIRAHGEATIEYVVGHPEEEAFCRELGFQLIWRGMTGK